MSNIKGLFNFIKSSPTAFHTVDTIKNILLQKGYTEVSERDCKSFSDGGKHFVIRGGSSLIAFRGSGNGFMISASHSDFPAFKVKNELSGVYAGLATEKYGGMIYYTWFDRPLSVAGRVMVKTKNGIASRLINIDRDILTIPSIAIHLNRTVNDGYKFNPAKDLLPLAGTNSSENEFMKTVALEAGVAVEDIISHDLFLYNREEGKVFGVKDEFILSPRLDDLSCVYSSLTAFLEADESQSISVFAVFDNEEVGSETKQGASSTFLDMTLKKIAGDEYKYQQMLADSFMISADNAHAIHPNAKELSDTTNAPRLSSGVVIKYNANQRYTTDASSDGIMRVIAERAGVKLQSYSNRADQLGGSTLGSISNTRVSVSTVDIGLPQLAMHSASESIAVSDFEDMVKLLSKFYSSSISVDGADISIG